MTDPAIQSFLDDRKEKWLKKQIKSNTSNEKREELETEAGEKFSLKHWLPDAAKRVTQLSMVSHSAKFSHPSAKVTPFIANGKKSNDGYVRTGNADVELDVYGNAAALDVDKFLRLILADGLTVFQHLQQNSEMINHIFRETDQNSEELVTKMLQIKGSRSPELVTSERVKQVYFPVESDYHLLSILASPGLIFELKARINNYKFSDEAKQAREAKQKGVEHPIGFNEIYGLTVIGFGGTKPQNIGVLNNKNGGKAYLLSSEPPRLRKQTVRLPSKSFFRENLSSREFKSSFQALRKLLAAEYNNVNIRNKRDAIIRSILFQIGDRMWEIRGVAEGWSDAERFGNLSTAQKIWLDSKYEVKRSEDSEWLNSIMVELTRWFINEYRHTARDRINSLGDEELQYIKDFISKNEDILL